MYEISRMVSEIVAWNFDGVVGACGRELAYRSD